MLLIHGGGETIEQCWGGWLPGLSARGLVVAVEEEGHGRTRPTDRPLTSESSARDVIAVLDDLGLPAVDVIAFSAGCRTTIALAAAHRARVRRLVLCSPPWRRDAMAVGFWDGFASATVDSMPREFRDEFLRLNPGNTAGLRRFFELDIGHMLEPDSSDPVLASVAAPALVVAGDRDVVTVDGSRRLTGHLPDARLLVLPAGHGDYLGQDAALATLVLPLVTRFLDGVRNGYCSPAASEGLNTFGGFPTVATDKTDADRSEDYASDQVGDRSNPAQTE